MQHTREFITQRFIPILNALKLPYTVEVVHFATDCDSIGQVRADVLFWLEAGLEPAAAAAIMSFPGLQAEAD